MVQVRTQQLRSLVETSLAFLGVTDEAGSIIYANEAMVTALGRTVDELIGLDYLSLVHPDDLHTVAVADARAHVEGMPGGVEARLQRRDGTWCIIRARYVPLPDEHVFLFSALDITDLRAHADLATASADVQLAIRRVSQVLLQPSGLLADHVHEILAEVGRMTAADHVHWYRHDPQRGTLRWSATWTAELALGAPHPPDEVLLPDPGGDIAVKAHGRPLVVDQRDGSRDTFEDRLFARWRVVRGIGASVVVEDDLYGFVVVDLGSAEGAAAMAAIEEVAVVAELMAGRLERERAEEALREHAQAARVVAELTERLSVPSPHRIVAAVDDSIRVLRAAFGADAVALYHRAGDHLIRGVTSAAEGAPAIANVVVLPAGVADDPRAPHFVFEAGSPAPAGTEVFVSAGWMTGLVVPVRPGGELAGMVVLLHHAPRRWPTWLGSLLGTLGSAICQALSREASGGELAERTAELLDANARLERANTQLAQANTRLEAFAWAVAHDLRSPLTLQMGAIEHLARVAGDALDTDARLLVERALDRSARMNDQLEGLLRLATRDSDELPARTPSDLAELAAQARDDLVEDLDGCGAVVVIGTLPVLEVAPVEIRDVFQNLLANAVKYRRLEVPLRIRIEAIRVGERWRFDVSDNGQGIPADARDTIFEAFVRRRTDHGTPGAGLGLAMCRRIIERHGGEIWVGEPMLGGTTICFTLPAA